MASVTDADIYKHFSSLSVKELIRYKTHLEGVISARTSADRKHVKALCVDDFITQKDNVIDATQEANILEELKSQKCFDSPGSKGTESLWITDSSMPYKWESKCVGTVSKNAVSFNEFKSVEMLMASLNKDSSLGLLKCIGC